jgi:hypothetical protein
MYAPTKSRPTISRVQHLLNLDRIGNAESLRKSGRNVAEMFEPNENVEVFDFSPVETHFAKTNVEHSAANIRAGMATPTKQIKYSSILGPRNVPGAPIRKRKTMRRRKNRHTRKN